MRGDRFGTGGQRYKFGHGVGARRFENSDLRVFINRLAQSLPRQRGEMPVTQVVLAVDDDDIHPFGVQQRRVERVLQQRDFCRVGRRPPRDLPDDHRQVMPGLQEHAILVRQQVITGHVQHRPQIGALRQRGNWCGDFARDGWQPPPELILEGDSQHEQRQRRPLDRLTNAYALP